MPEIRKQINFGYGHDTYLKRSAKPTNFEVSSLGLGLEFQVSYVGLRIFDEVSVSKFWRCLGLKGYGLDYITAIFIEHILKSHLGMKHNKIWHSLSKQELQNRKLI